MGGAHDWLIDDMYVPMAPVGTPLCDARSQASAKQV